MKKKIMSVLMVISVFCAMIQPTYAVVNADGGSNASEGRLSA